jgi:hypothetical protein
VLAALYKLMRTASIVICAIVVVSFLIFALDQTKTASGQQQSALRNGSSGGPSAEGTPKQHKNGFHQAIDDTASTFTSPFTGIVSASKSEWGDQMVKLLLTLLVYGFGLGFAARMIRVRA